ncbi:hypothetical protein PC128_g10320 [Phytophthora cactorum]|nr:hypothetical protein PC128_g10320 [Phytophthora cactorum]KAG4047533.1 hypothetical protein PC123_g17119 [Phytophthora cactorum]
MREPGQTQAAAWTAVEGCDDGVGSNEGCSDGLESNDGCDDGQFDATRGPVRVGHTRWKGKLAGAWKLVTHASVTKAVKNNRNSNSERMNEQDEDVKSDDIDKLKYEESAQC